MLSKLKQFLKDFVVEGEVEVQHKILTVPNLITGIGFLLLGLYVFLFTKDIYTFLIPFVIIAIGASDLLDGLAARILNQHSRIGKLLDPARDKLFAFALVINMVIFDGGQFSAMWAGGIIATELLLVVVALISANVLSTGGKVHTVGKVRMGIHLVAGFVFVVSSYAPSLWSSTISVNVSYLLFIMFVASFVAAIVYVRNLIPSSD